MKHKVIISYERKDDEVTIDVFGKTDEIVAGMIEMTDSIIKKIFKDDVNMQLASIDAIHAITKDLIKKGVEK